MEPNAMILVFWMLSFKPTFLLSSLTFIKRLFSSSSLSAIRMVLSAYMRLLIFLPAILIPACASSSLAFRKMYSAYKLNNQGDNMQPWRIPFPIWNQSVVPYPVLTVASWGAYRFLRRQVRWSDISISFRIFQFVVTHTVKGFSIIKEAKVDDFLEFSCLSYDPTDVRKFDLRFLCFFYDPVDVGNLISGSSAFCKTNLNIWNLSVYVLLKPSLENFEHYFASMGDECNFAVVWTFLVLPFFVIGMKTDLFQPCGHCCFPNLLAYWAQHFHSIIFQDLK